MKRPVAQLRGRLRGLDTLRALAILSVITYHLTWKLPERFQPVARVGWMGVDLFFVLSGYLIGTQLLKPYLRGETVHPFEFYRKRAYRILPAYFVVLLLYFAVPAWREAPGISPPWQFVTFTENLFIDYSVHQAFSQVWSLCVEEHFYLLLPLLALFMMRKPGQSKTVTLIAAIVLGGIMLRGFVLFHILRPLGAGNDGFGVAYIEKIYYPTWTRLDGLLAGVTLALVKLFRHQWWSAIEARGHSLLAGGVGLLALSVWLFKDRFDSATGSAAVGTVIGFPILSLGLGLIVASAISINGLLSRVTIPGARAAATLAFSLYLTHKEALHFVQQHFPVTAEEAGVKAIALYALACLGVAAMLYFCVERPFLLLRDRRERGRIAVDQEARTEPAL